MPTISIFFIRTALIYLVSGFGLGALLLANKALMFDNRLWEILPLHIELVLFGWTLQLIFGVAFWIMPRLPEGYGKIHFAWLSYILLNTGLILSAFLFISKTYFYPLSSSGNLFLLSMAFIFTGILSFAVYIRPRVRQVIVKRH